MVLTTYQGHQSWELGWSQPPDFGQGVVGCCRRVVWGREILSCTGSMFESGDFWREME